MENYGVVVNEVVNTGGLSLKNPTLMQIYADVINKPMVVSDREQTCALGAALLASVAAGAGTLQDLQRATVRYQEKVFQPIPENVAVYEKLFAIYSDLHDNLGNTDTTSNLSHVMKDLIAIREQVRSA